MTKFEVFSADCPPCRETVDNLQAAVDDAGCGCEVEVIICSGDECCDEAKQYGIDALPTTVKDGKIVKVGRLTRDEAGALLPV